MRLLSSNLYSKLLTHRHVAGADENRSLMEHEITLEFGPKLNKKRVIHEELLCCYSQTMLDRFTRAKESRISHEKADHMRKYLKLCMHDIQASEDDEDSENKVRRCNISGRARVLLWNVHRSALVQLS